MMEEQNSEFYAMDDNPMMRTNSGGGKSGVKGKQIPAGRYTQVPVAESDMAAYERDSSMSPSHTRMQSDKDISRANRSAGRTAKSPSASRAATSTNRRDSGKLTSPARAMDRSNTAEQSMGNSRNAGGTSNVKKSRSQSPEKLVRTSSAAASNSKRSASPPKPARPVPNNTVTTTPTGREGGANAQQIKSRGSIGHRSGAADSSDRTRSYNNIVAGGGGGRSASPQKPPRPDRKLPPAPPSSEQRRSGRYTAVDLEDGATSAAGGTRQSVSPPPPRDEEKNGEVEGVELKRISIGSSGGSRAVPNLRPLGTSSSAKDGTGGGGGSSSSSDNKQQAAGGSEKAKADASSIYVGEKLITVGIWAHWLAFGAALLSICMGVFAIAWTQADTYGCKIEGDEISSVYLFNSDGSCPSTYTNDKGVTRDICCNPDSSSGLDGYPEIGAYYVVYGVFMLFYENIDWGFGLWFPNHTGLYHWRVSFIGSLHVLCGLIGLYNYATCLAGACWITAGAVYVWAAWRKECGDGGRLNRKRAAAKAAEAKKNDSVEMSACQYLEENFSWLLSFNPITFCRRIYNEDKLSSYVWTFIFFAVNIVLFAYTLSVWYGAVFEMEDELLDGTLRVDCDSFKCHVNRKAVRFGPVSRYAPWAKACGGCLNLNCSLILLPIIRNLLRKLNNWGESLSAAQQQSDVLGQICARPLTRYIPLQKNIEFHKLCAASIFVFAWGHMIFHFINLMFANKVTLRFFRAWGWDGTDFFTGAIITYAMFMIYTSAPDAVRMAKYEIFFRTHHFFIIFFFFLFLHGPVFFFWSCIPVLLYLLERYLQTMRGNRPYLLVKVEWIEPVMAIYFRPMFKEHFPFKEGQYLYVNCPYISESEWHPFTISSAYDDLHNGPRIHLETGEEVVEVPRPRNLPPNARWNKFCLVSQDYSAMDPNDYLDKSDTGYCDFISIHVKVHGLQDAHAKTWTRRLKEYFELMSPGVKKFPFFFNERDSRGDIHIGRQNGPDGKQILRIDGPHSAPSEHYTNYGTVMLIGAGIGLTPCASILCALTKYRWKKNFNPEIVHFYWIVRQNEVDSFQWLVHMLTELSFELKKGKAMNQIDRSYYCEIHIYVTGVDRKPRPVLPLHRPKRQFYHASCKPTFTADELYSLVLNPTVSSKGQISRMKDVKTTNRLQDIWVWNGRPQWDEVFRDMKEQRQHSDIGVCFCGAPVIGADLRSMCEKYSDAEEQCLFTLHKENF